MWKGLGVSLHTHKDFLFLIFYCGRFTIFAWFLIHWVSNHLRGKQKNVNVEKGRLKTLDQIPTIVWTNSFNAEQIMYI